MPDCRPFRTILRFWVSVSKITQRVLGFYELKRRKPSPASFVARVETSEGTKPASNSRRKYSKCLLSPPRMPLSAEEISTGADGFSRVRV